MSLVSPRSSSDDDKAHHNSALSAFIVKKICLIESFNEAARIGGRNLHMTEVVRKPRSLHTGIASCKTLGFDSGLGNHLFNNFVALHVNKGRARRL